MSNVVIFYGFLFFLFAGSIILQVFLAKGGSKWLGLILPIISFVISLLPILALWFLMPYKTITESVDGATISQTVNTVGSVASIGFTSLLMLIILNIPTAILLAIYFAFRVRNKKERELNKMNIQDLGDL